MADSVLPLEQVQALVLDDGIALDKWLQIVYRVVSNPADQLRLKKAISAGQYEECVRDTLKIWNSTGRRVNLLQQLCSQGLNSLAGKLEEEGLLQQVWPSPVDCATPGSWFEVGELPENFVPRTKDLAELHSLMMQNEAGKKSVVLAFGAGGTGKSVLARSYAREHWGTHFSNVVWIAANTMAEMRASFLRLAQLLALATDDNTSVERLAILAYEKLGQDEKRSLIIFADLKEEVMIEKYLPNSINPKLLVPYTIITTRNVNSTIQAKLLLLDVFQPEEALKLLQGKTNNLPIALAQNLAEIVQYRPSALQGLTKLISDERLHRGNAMLTFSTWVESLTFFLADLDSNVEAKHLLQLLSYLNPTQISRDFLNTLDSSLDSSLAILFSLSLIKIKSDGRIAVHCLGQGLVRLLLSAAVESQILAQIIKALNVYNGDKTSFHGESMKHACHLRAFLSKHTELVSMTFDDSLSLFFAMLYQSYTSVKDYTGGLSVARQGRAIFESKLGIDSHIVIAMQMQEASALRSLERYRESLDVLEPTLALIESAQAGGRLTSYSYRVFCERIMNSISQLYLTTGNNAGAIEVLQRHETLATELHGACSNRVLEGKLVKAAALMKLGDVAAAAELCRHVRDNATDEIIREGGRVMFLKYSK